MKKNLIELVFILDKSGSMVGKEKDVVGGFNAMIEKQKREDGDALVTTVLFSNNSTIISDRLNIKDIKPLSLNDYFACGGTALFDAIGCIIDHIKHIHKYAKQDDVPEHTLFVITTDGLENSSSKYNHAKIKEMIKEQEKSGWEFLFVAEGIDNAENSEIVEMAKDIGIKDNGILVPQECHYKVFDYYENNISDTVAIYRRNKNK